MNTLERIVAARLADLEKEESAVPLAQLENMALEAPSPRDFRSALARPGLSVIAEVKRASPSRGDIAPDVSPDMVARDYEHGGAAAVSVLTERQFFRGSEEDLRKVRAGVSLPILRKDFILREWQVLQSRAIGADAILLIAAILEDRRMRALSRLAAECGLAVLFEAHDAEELHRVLDCGALIVGINNRDLRTFATSLDTFEKLRPLVPQGVLAVAESGISSQRDALRMKNAGADAVLVGECLMRARDRAAAVREMAGV